MEPKETETTIEATPENIEGAEALERMKRFADRKERFIAAVKESEDRDLSA